MSVVFQLISSTFSSLLSHFTLFILQSRNIQSKEIFLRFFSSILNVSLAVENIGWILASCLCSWKK